MEKSKELNIEGIGLSQACIEFLQKRLASSDYRGWHYSQHNRYTFEEVVEIFNTLNDFIKKSGSEYLSIRTTDVSKRPKNYPHEQVFADFCREVKKKIGKGKQDAMRKNFFVDFNRMNLLERYDTEGKLIEKGEKKKVSKVKISELGKELVNSPTMFEKYLVYSKATDFLLEGVMEALVSIMREINENNSEKYLEIEEFQFFVSFVGKELDGVICDSQAITEFLLEYRNLSDSQKDYLIKEMKKYCNPKDFQGNKKDKRDFHNWENGVRQLLNLLSTTAYFEFDSIKRRLLLGKSDYKENKNIWEISKLIRSNLEKKNYFEKHNISKKLGFELHHVKPLFWVKTAEELKLTDNWKNMLYMLMSIE
ncbi:MAG: hypothetical protein I3270_00460 [Candidatus Moeniiplasma glomeromycotorum]|nr:hypothetical protein [Candidatus Moeniiplasma glomeromycotorum]MCE8162235.1 hypothetical protein [Candidatus Moeniiplasma glomeromycotorum]MCE8166109.1 hypothetical protein [Candidatus Moeniiplasma glomeromycotorum]MCE8166634.1 hypothetical protein [Candidatus Moeniiplasma glomeromycotorum]